MKEITGFFLRAKHWQVFALLWGTYLAGEIAIVIALPEASGSAENPLKAGLYAEAFMLPAVVCLMAWLWSMGSFLFLTTRPTLRLSIRSFQFSIIFLMLYLLTALPFFLSPNPTVQIIIFPAHLLCMLCLIYCFYFVSKSLLIAEKDEQVTFNDYALSLLLLFFSLIGIWLIQPRINRLYAASGA